MERRTYSDQEIQQVNQAEKELRAKGLDEQGQRIGDLIDEFFQTNRGVPVTVAAIFKLVEAQPGLKWLSQAQLEYNKVASENVHAAQQLVAWLNTQGKPGQLANTGDDAFRNLTELLLELRGYEVTLANINAAVARIQAPRGKFVAREGRRPLHYVQAPRRTEPISAAAKNDDGARFLGDDLVKQSDGSWRSKTVAEQRRDAEAANANSSQGETRTLDASEQSWKNMTLGLLQDGTHSQKARLRSVYDHEEAQGSSWRRIYEACKQETDASVAFRNAKRIQEELKQRS